MAAAMVAVAMGARVEVGVVKVVVAKGVVMAAMVEAVATATQHGKDVSTVALVPGASEAAGDSLCTACNAYGSTSRKSRRVIGCEWVLTDGGEGGGGGGEGGFGGCGVQCRHKCQMGRQGFAAVTAIQLDALQELQSSNVMRTACLFDIIC